MKQNTLAKLASYSPNYISMIKNGRKPLTLKFAKNCEKVTGITCLKLIDPERFGSFWEALEKI